MQHLIVLTFLLLRHEPKLLLFRDPIRVFTLRTLEIIDVWVDQKMAVVHFIVVVLKMHHTSLEDILLILFL